MLIRTNKIVPFRLDTNLAMYKATKEFMLLPTQITSLMMGKLKLPLEEGGGSWEDSRDSGADCDTRKKCTQSSTHKSHSWKHVY